MIDSGGCSTIIVDAEDNVYVAGENTKGLLGLNSKDWKFKTCEFTKIPALRQRKVTKVSCGWWHALAVADNGASLFGWGWNKYGQLGIDPNSDSNDLRDGTLSQVGFNETIVLPTEIVCSDSTEQMYVDVSCGWKHSLLLSVNGTVYSSGSNIHGQLGIDSSTHQNVYIHFRKFRFTIKRQVILQCKSLRYVAGGSIPRLWVTSWANLLLPRLFLHGAQINFFSLEEHKVVVCNNCYQIIVPVL